jgi:hypothetical protein
LLDPNYLCRSMDSAFASQSACVIPRRNYVLAAGY